jgi:hypothetical protein
VQKNHTLVTLRFHQVDGLYLEDFNAQNVLFDFQITEVPEGDRRQDRVEVGFRASYGVHASFLCRRISVLSATPWSPRQPGATLFRTDSET